jgi:ribosomal protein S27AE
MIDLHDVKVRDKFFAPIPQYNVTFFKGYKVVQVEVVKVNPKSVLLAWDKSSLKNPQKVLKGPVDTYERSELAVWQGIKKYVDGLAKPTYYDDLALKQAELMIKKLSKCAGCDKKTVFVFKHKSRYYCKRCHDEVTSMESKK